MKPVHYHGRGCWPICWANAPGERQEEIEKEKAVTDIRRCSCEACLIRILEITTKSLRYKFTIGDKY